MNRDEHEIDTIGETTCEKLADQLTDRQGWIHKRITKQSDTAIWSSIKKGSI